MQASNNQNVVNFSQPQSDDERLKKLISKRTVKILGITQLVCAFIAIITQIILLSHMDSDFDIIPAFGAGLWTGFFFGITGFIGLFASQKPSKCK